MWTLDFLSITVVSSGGCTMMCGVLLGSCLRDISCSCSLWTMHLHLEKAEGIGGPTDLSLFSKFLFCSDGGWIATRAWPRSKEGKCGGSTWYEREMHTEEGNGQTGLSPWPLDSDPFSSSLSALFRGEKRVHHGSVHFPRCLYRGVIHKVKKQKPKKALLVF